MTPETANTPAENDSSSPSSTRGIRVRPSRQARAAGRTSTKTRGTGAAEPERVSLPEPEPTTELASEVTAEAAPVLEEAAAQEVVVEPVPFTSAPAEPTPTALPEPQGTSLAEPSGAEPSGAEPSGAEPMSAPESNTAPEPMPAQTPRPETGRIEVPIPSVVRARERGKIAQGNPVVLRTELLTKTYGSLVAADEVSIEVHGGSFTGIVGPNGAGKTTTLSMISGLLRPSSGTVTVSEVDVWRDGPQAKRKIGSLPDRLRLFDRLTGAQLLYYSGVLQGVDEASLSRRTAELSTAFGLDSALDRFVSDYSAGMQKKIALACAMIHAPDVLVLDEPFEAIDPVSASNVTEILEMFVSGGGSVIMSSHSLDLIQRVCDHVSIIVQGQVIAQGTVDEVRDGMSLDERFRHLTGDQHSQRGLEWLQGSSDSV